MWTPSQFTATPTTASRTPRSWRGRLTVPVGPDPSLRRDLEWPVADLVIFLHCCFRPVACSQSAYKYVHILSKYTLVSYMEPCIVGKEINTGH